MERLLSAREVGALLDLAPEVVRKLARDGKLRVVKLSARRVRFPEPGAAEFLDRTRLAGGSAPSEAGR